MLKLACALVASAFLFGPVPCLLGQGIASSESRPVAAAKRSGKPFLAKFENVAAERGIDAISVYGSDEAKNYIMEANGGGVAWIDYDNDGLLDAFLSNGSVLEGDSERTSQLFRQVELRKFEDVTAEAGVGRAGWGGGVCVGDYDNDGDSDLFVAYWGLNSLYRNGGDGKFEDVAAAAGVAGPPHEWSSGCTFVDYDRDGLLDLAVTQYQQFDLKTAAPPGKASNCQWKGMDVFCGPRGLPFGGITLYRNRGEGEFEDVSQKSGARDGQQVYAFTAITTDLDGDGWGDIYVACDSTPNLFYINNGDGTISDFAAETGLAFNEHGFEQGGMGIGVGDFNRDGLLDMVKTNFAGDYPNLYQNTGDGIFEDVVIRAGLAVNPHFVGWGVELADLDNDGWQDIFEVNGHVYPRLDAQDKVREIYRQPNVVYRNLGSGKFEDVTDLAGPGLEEKRSSRGAAFGDYDNDGDVDVLVMNMGEPVSLFENGYDGGGHWLRVRLEGTKSNRSAIGAQVTVWTGDDQQSKAILSQSSFLSHNDLRAHFGLGEAKQADRIVVRWPSGDTEEFPGSGVDRDVLLIEGSSQQ